MKFTPELIAVAVAILIFYLRIAMLRGKKKRLEREFALKRRRVKGRSKGNALPAKKPGQAPYSITSWWLVSLGMILMLFGLGVYTLWWFKEYQTFWWIPITLGVLVFAFCFKIDMPNLDEE